MVFLQRFLGIGKGMTDASAGAPPPRGYSNEFPQAEGIELAARWHEQQAELHRQDGALSRWRAVELARSDGRMSDMMHGVAHRQHEAAVFHLECAEKLRRLRDAQ